MKKIKTALLFAMVAIVAIPAERKYISFDGMFFRLSEETFYGVPGATMIHPSVVEKTGCDYIELDDITTQDGVLEFHPCERGCYLNDTIIVPETIDYKGVKYTLFFLDAGAIESYSAKYLQLPPTIHRVESYAITLPQEVKEVRFPRETYLEVVKPDAFYNLQGIDVYLPDRIKEYAWSEETGKIHFSDSMIMPDIGYSPIFKWIEWVYANRNHVLRMPKTRFSMMLESFYSASLWCLVIPDISDFYSDPRAFTDVRNFTTVISMASVPPIIGERHGSQIAYEFLDEDEKKTIRIHWIKLSFLKPAFWNRMRV